MAMAEIAPDLRQRYLKEQQEYLDAVSAYEQTLNRVAGSMLSPIATQTNYSVQSEGYKRAATDPWMSQNHPDLAAAANRLAKEEGEYRALDDPSASHGNNKCSIANYTAEKFYEYVAAAEMLYLLATDENFRKDVVAKVGVMFERGGAISDFFAVANAGFAAESQAHIGGNQQAFEANEITIKEGQEASVRLVNRLKAYFSEKWQAFKKGWEECGLANAVARAGIDGLFLAGEILIGGAAIRGVKFAYALTKEGLHRIEIIAVDKAVTVGERSWSKAALEDKYGKPEQNQVAGLLEDRNRSIKDGPAQPPKEADTTKKDKEREKAPANRWNKKEVNGRTVYQRDDLIDPEKLDDEGRSNLQRMRQGLAPIGSDGHPMELHHMLQQEKTRINGKSGPLAEVEKTFHSDNYNAIHIYPRGDQDYISWRKIFPEDAKAYDKYRKEYWKNRAKDNTLGAKDE